MDKIEENKAKENKKIEKAIAVFLILGFVFTVFNQFQLISIKSGSGVVPTTMAFAEASIIPTGTPKVYGSELGIKYNDVSANDPNLADKTIEVLANIDRTVTLQGSDLERYIDIASQMSCEYCCGAGSIIVRREDVEAMNKKVEAAIASGQITSEQAKQYKKNAGDLACGCEHSYAMRGLAKYLITKHGSEYSDEEILEELAKWKTLFFPGQMAAKAGAMKDQGIEFSYSNLGSNKYRGIEKGTAQSGGMVGGC